MCYIIIVVQIEISVILEPPVFGSFFITLLHWLIHSCIQCRWQKITETSVFSESVSKSHGRRTRKLKAMQCAACQDQSYTIAEVIAETTS